MVVNCRACGRFVSPTDGATSISCIKCTSAFHRKCIGTPDSVRILPAWLCPQCKETKVGSAGMEPPITSQDVEVPNTSQDPDHQSADGPLHSTALNNTEEFTVDLVLEIRQFRREMLAMREEMRTFMAEVMIVKDAVTRNTAQIELLSSRVEALEKRGTSEGSSYIAELENALVELKLDINDRDQDMLLNDIEVTNVPEEANESPIHLAKLVATKLGVPLEERDIVSAERVGPRSRGDGGAVPGRPRALVVRLARRSLRDGLLQGARARRGATTAEFGLNSDPRVFYVNERLSKINRRLFYLAREAGRKQGWRFIWTRDGRVNARREPGQAWHRIRSEDDIGRVFGEQVVGSS